MTFGTKYDYVMPTGELNSGEIMVEEENYVNAESRIKAIMYSGRMLTQTAPGDFDSYGDDIDSFESETDFEIGYRNESDLVDIQSSLQRAAKTNAEIINSRKSPVEEGGKEETTGGTGVSS